MLTVQKPFFLKKNEAIFLNFKEKIAKNVKLGFLFLFFYATINYRIVKGGTYMNEKPKTTMSIIGEDGSIDEVEVVIAFEFKDTKKEYVVYTKNEKDDNGNVTVYVSQVDRSGDTPKLYGIDDEEEWNRVKDVLRKLSKKD